MQLTPGACLQGCLAERTPPGMHPFLEEVWRRCSAASLGQRWTVENASAFVERCIWWQLASP